MKNLRRTLLISAILLGMFLTPTPPSAEAEGGVSFIVNADCPLTEISASDLYSMFLKKKREWPDGTEVRFIDQKDGSEVRTTFLRRYLKKTGRDIELFWIGQKLYNGDSAPMQVDSDSGVASLVASFKGAIGYVSPGFTTGKGVKKIAVLGRGPD